MKKITGQRIRITDQIIGHRIRRAGGIITIGSGSRGGKGENVFKTAGELARIKARTGERIAKIPRTVHICDDVIKGVEGDKRLVKELVGGIVEKGALSFDSRFLAVRSSANCEDGEHVFAGLFDSRFIRFQSDRDLEALERAIVEVSLSENRPGIQEYARRCCVSTDMSLLIQTVVGSDLPNAERFYAPRFAGVVDTSAVNGEGTTTISVVLGLGTVAAGNMHAGNIIIIDNETGRCEIHKEQVDGEALVSQKREKPIARISLRKFLHYCRFRGVDQALEYFIEHHIGPVRRLAQSIEIEGGVDIEFAIPLRGGERLYYIQNRKSNFRSTRNPDYLESIDYGRRIAMTTNVLGGETINASSVAMYKSGQAYIEDAKDRFRGLYNLDRQGQKYILVVPSEATSSTTPNLPLGGLNNLVMVIEEPIGSIHYAGVTGVDHYTRMFFAHGIPYMEAMIDIDRLKTVSYERPTDTGSFRTFDGNFIASVCGATKRGILISAED